MRSMLQARQSLVMREEFGYRDAVDAACMDQSDQTCCKNEPLKSHFLCQQVLQHDSHSFDNFYNLTVGRNNLQR